MTLKLLASMPPLTEGQKLSYVASDMGNVPAYRDVTKRDFKNAINEALNMDLTNLFRETMMDETGLESQPEAINTVFSNFDVGRDKVVHLDSGEYKITLECRMLGVHKSEFEKPIVQDAIKNVFRVHINRHSRKWGPRAPLLRLENISIRNLSVRKSREIACQKYLLWWAHHGVHPVRIIYKLYSDKVFQEWNQREIQRYPSRRAIIPTILPRNLLRMVLRDEEKFKVAIPLMDAETRQLTGKLERILGLNCADLLNHRVINENRMTHHIDVNEHRPTASVYMFKGNSISFVRLEGDTPAKYTHAEFDRNIVNVNQYGFWLAPNALDRRYVRVEWPVHDRYRTLYYWQIKLKIVKCLGYSDNGGIMSRRNVVCLKEDGHLYINDRRIPHYSAPYVDVQYAAQDHASNLFFVLSALGNVYMIECPMREIHRDTAFRDTDFRITTVYSVQMAKHLRAGPDPVVQIVTNTISAKFEVVTRHASGDVCFYKVKDNRAEYVDGWSISEMNSHFHKLPNDNMKVTLIPKCLRWHMVTFIEDDPNDDEGDIQVNRPTLVTVVDYNSLICFAAQGELYHVIRAIDDRNEIDLHLAIEMVQAQDYYVFFLLATGEVYGCKIDYDDMTYRSTWVRNIHAFTEHVGTLSDDDDQADYFRSSLRL